MDFSGIGTTALGWLKSGFIWTIGIIIILLIIGVFYIKMKKRGKLKYIVLELVMFGNGKVGINRLKAGIFGNKSALFGLFDYGGEFVVKTNDGRIIQGAKSRHLHDIFGKKGFVVVRHPKDPRILIPLDKIYTKNLNLLVEIAPGEYIDAAVGIYQEATKETMGLWDKILPYLMIGGVVILCIITVIINQQMTNNTVNKVGDMLIKGCQNTQNVQPSGAP